MMRNLFLNSTLVLAAFTSVCVVSVLKDNYEETERDALNANTKAAVAAVIVENTVKEVAETKAEVVTLEKALAMEEAMRMNTQAVLEFVREHEAIVVICARKDGKIFKVNGEAGIVGWHKGGLLRSNVKALITPSRGKTHATKMRERAKEGRTGKVQRFYNRPSVTETGQTTNVDGLVLWFHDAGEFMGIFAKPK